MKWSTKQAIHAALLLTTVALYARHAWEQSRRSARRRHSVNLIRRYGFSAAFALYALRYSPLFAAAQTALQLLGLLTCKCFRDGDGVPLRPWALAALRGGKLPQLCFRVVTRGDNETLVQKTVRHNLATLLAARVNRFRIEVVTDWRLRLAADDDERVSQTVVPHSYSTPNGSLYKARALHYALLHSGAAAAAGWIVHLDEETMLDRSSVHGILNFVAQPRNRCSFGQGTIDYGPACGAAQSRFVNCCDAFRVAVDHSLHAFVLSRLRRPLYGLKGSFLVARAGAERAVGFDGGPRASLTEDCRFALSADSLGHAVGHIEGEMHEQSPYTVADMVRQRKRWFLGMMLTASAGDIPMRSKILLIAYILSSATLPYILFGNAFLRRLLPRSALVDVFNAVTHSLALYMYAFGALKNFPAIYGGSRLKVAAMVACTVLCMPLSVALEMAAMQCAVAHFLWLSLGYGSIAFHVVKKQL